MHACSAAAAVLQKQQRATDCVLQQIVDFRQEVVCACMQGLSACTAATAAMLAAAAQVAFATSPSCKPGGQGGWHKGVGAGFHGAVEAAAVPEEVQQAMHWHEAREGPGHASLARCRFQTGYYLQCNLTLHMCLFQLAAMEVDLGSCFNCQVQISWPCLLERQFETEVGLLVCKMSVTSNGSCSRVISYVSAARGLTTLVSRAA